MYVMAADFVLVFFDQYLTSLTPSLVDHHCGWLFVCINVSSAVGRQLSEHVGTEGCSDNRIVQIAEVQMACIHITQ